MPSVTFLATYDGEAALRLPPTELDLGTSNPQDVRGVFRQQTGLDAFVLHSGGLGLNLERDSYTVRLELVSPLASLSTAYPQLPQARPWQQAGWFKETLAWLETTLNETVTGLEQVSSNDLGAVLRVETASRTAYLKASETELEATLNAHLASSHSGLTPVVLAWDASRNLLLTQDCGARLSETAAITLWQCAVRKLAHFQRTADGSALRALGCPTHSFDDLAGRAALFLQDDAALTGCGLKPEHIGALKECLPQIIKVHERVRGLERPLVPAHGDAHPMNALTGCGAVWFDWSETCIAHPFLDIGWFLAWLSHPGRVGLPLHQQSPNTAAALWHTYLQAASLPEAKALMREAMLLALTHRALVYHERFFDWQGTLPGWRPGYVPFLLRSLLRLPL